jgi:hypothetical protein
MSENNRFYVYCHRRKTDGKCFYIGKGTGLRSETTYSRNRYWMDVVEKHGFTSHILVNNITEQKAFELESMFCKQIGYENLLNIRKENGWGGHSHSTETLKKLSKPVLQYDLQGNFIKEWKSASEAAVYFKKHPAAITECCRGHRNYIYGFIWRYKNNPIEQEIKFVPKKSKKETLPPYYNPVNQYDLQGNFIKTWNNSREASLALNLKPGAISNCINGKYKSSGGFKWIKSINKKGGYFA